LVTGSLLFALVIAELFVRTFFPLHGGRDNVSLDGRRLRTFLEPGSVYRQISSEYNALTTITDKGHRVPIVKDNPDVVFLGDSYTFGWGLTDDEAFASIYCKRKHLECANLGMPASGTANQVARLQEYLDAWNWRPRKVKLFFFGMSSSFSAGNDFNDNYIHERLRAQESAAPEDATGDEGRESLTREQTRPGFGGWIIASQAAILDHFHIMRHVKYHWGPLLRSMVRAVPDERRRMESLSSTGRALRELDELSRKTGFEYDIYLIVPAHDILMGTYRDTLAMLDSVAPKPAIPTAHLFVDAPRDFYFSYDGHLNSNGSRRLAEFLIAREPGG
jgi:hypothetical protein